MSTRSSLGAVAMAALLVLAGCAGPIGNSDRSAGVAGDAATPADGGTVGSDAGTVEFYVSDEENAIEDFAHLDVTITKVGLHRTGGGDDDGDEGDETNEPTETPEPTETDETATLTAATSSPSATATSEGEADGADGADGEPDGNTRDVDATDDGKAGWVEYGVNRTVDLTELRGANATSLGTLAAPDGSYDKVFVYVDGIEATLENGETVNVKLPSQKLQIKKGFAVGKGRNVSFVFDVSVKRAGKSGKYILRPIVGQSGTSEDVAIDDVDEREDEDGSAGDDDEPGSEREPDGESSLSAEFQGSVEAGGNATLTVTGAEGPVANATVEVNGEAVGTTDASGTVTFAVPGDAEDVEVTVTKGDAEVELAADVKGGDGDGNPSLGLATRVPLRLAT